MVGTNRRRNLLCMVFLDFGRSCYIIPCFLVSGILMSICLYLDISYLLIIIQIRIKLSDVLPFWFWSRDVKRGLCVKFIFKSPFHHDKVGEIGWSVSKVVKSCFQVNNLLVFALIWIDAYAFFHWFPFIFEVMIFILLSRKCQLLSSLHHFILFFLVIWRSLFWLFFSLTEFLLLLNQRIDGIFLWFRSVLHSLRFWWYLVQGFILFLLGRKHGHQWIGLFFQHNFVIAKVFFISKTSKHDKKAINH